MIKIVEVGPRDGLQNETATVPIDGKVAFALGALGSDHGKHLTISNIC